MQITQNNGSFTVHFKLQAAGNIEIFKRFLSYRKCELLKSLTHMASGILPLYLLKCERKYHLFFKKALTVLRGPLAYPNGLLDLDAETFGRTSWPRDQPNARPLPTQDNTTQKHADTHPCPKKDLNLRSQCSSDRRQYMP
jgi:hypothetical protein